VNGCRAMAVSMAAAESMHWSAARPVVRRALDLLFDLAHPFVLNVNIPNVPEADLRGLRQGSLASFGAVQTTISQVDAGSLHIGVAEHESELEPGTDAALVAANFACVTALQPLCASELPLRVDAEASSEAR